MSVPTSRMASSLLHRLTAALQPTHGALPLALGGGAMLATGVVTFALSNPSVTAILQAALMTGLAAGIGSIAALFRGRPAATRTDERFATLIESVRDAVVRFEANGEAGYLSPSAEALFGSRRYELSGTGIAERVHVMDRPAFLTAMAEATGDGAVRLVEVRMRRDGDHAGYFWCEASLNPVGTDGKGPYEVVAVLRDVSERRASAEARERARVAAEDASDAKSRFLATMGHELRTPLNAIVGFSEMMKSGIGGALSDTHRDYAGLIHQSGHHLLDVINMLLDMSKIEAGRFELAAEPFDPATLADPCMHLVRAQAADRRIALRLDATTSLPLMRGDERACRQILINLLSNAVKFSREGGTVTLSMRRRGAAIVFSVTDDGIGMAQDTVDRLGEPFYQAQDGLSRRYEGTGLGLSIVKGLVGLHEGRLEVASHPGRGTTVTVNLPIAGPGATPASADIEPLRVEPASKVKDEWPAREQRSAAR